MQNLHATIDVRDSYFKLKDSTLQIFLEIDNNSNESILIPTSVWNYDGNFPDTLDNIVPFNYQNNWTNYIHYYSLTEQGIMNSAGFESGVFSSLLRIPKFILIESGKKTAIEIQIDIKDNFEKFHKYSEQLFLKIQLAYTLLNKFYDYEKMLNYARAYDLDVEVDFFQIYSDLPKNKIIIEHKDYRNVRYYQSEFSNIFISECESLALNLIMEKHINIECKFRK